MLQHGKIWPLKVHNNITQHTKQWQKETLIFHYCKFFLIIFCLFLIQKQHNITSRQSVLELTLCCACLLHTTVRSTWTWESWLGKLYYAFRAFRDHAVTLRAGRKLRCQTPKISLYGFLYTSVWSWFAWLLLKINLWIPLLLSCQSELGNAILNEPVSLQSKVWAGSELNSATDARVQHFPHLSCY